MDNFLEYKNLLSTNNQNKKKCINNIENFNQVVNSDISDANLSWNLAVLLIAIFLFIILIYFNNRSESTKSNLMENKVGGLIDTNSILDSI
jgi:hypothetical protein